MEWYQRIGQRNSSQTQVLKKSRTKYTELDIFEFGGRISGVGYSTVTNEYNNSSVTALATP